ncbi:Phosphoinositide phospholipase C [Mycena sanguinolenta]|uniref:Phosphoinositide phospholipase C n=1 Tax=Mycena sanguinolenta TaxID=230812 RepID=A0A8H7DFZ3_9AGAR|nr:Phosphoinositide phospholipase C [Mycena sanguinolenta]
MATTTLDFIPPLLQQGTQLTKISDKSQKKVVFRLDPEEGQILYDSWKHGIVPIESIKEIRTGSDAEYYCSQYGFAGELDKWITIVYVLHNTYRTLHLLAPTCDLKTLWENNLRKLYSIRLGLMHDLDNHELRQTVWERQYWKGAAKGRQSLNLDDVKSICLRLNIDFPKGELERLFKAPDTTQKNSLNFQQFQHFVKLLKRRPELEALYKKLCGEETLDFAKFEKFMKDTQQSTLSSVELKIVFDKYANVDTAPVVVPPPTVVPPAPTLTVPTSTNVSAVPPVSPVLPPPTLSATTADSLAAPTSPPPAPATIPALPKTDVAQSSPSPSSARNMSLDGFSSFLMSQDNAPTQPESNDMTQPMSDYFISTSHNTYLIGNQLMGVSTIEGYIRALLCGARSVELDIYDGPHEPMVYHGKTLTSEVSVREICQAIAKYAFVSSPYPIILSCEVHCGLVQQDMLVDIMTKAFGSALVRVALDEHPNKLVALPSPEQLKKRIMVKTKNMFVSAELDAIKAHKQAAKAAAAKAAHLEAEVPSSSSESETDAQSIMQEIGQEISSLKSKWKKLRGVPSGSTDSKKKGKTKAPMSMALASLLVYTVGVKCRGIDKSQEYDVEQVFSLSENSANKYIKGGAGIEDLIRHTQSHVVRIYPKGSRVNSTNYEPLQYWAAGCQLVALNIQTMDLGYRINQAMFLRRGRQGYVLKPPALRDVHFEALRKHTNHYFDVTIISAQQLPRPTHSSGKEVTEKSIVDPYVEVTHIPPSDNSGGEGTSARKISFATPAVKNNGFNPMWQEELCLPFDCLGGMQELIFVEFTVKQDKRPDLEPLARHISPLASLQRGFRHLPLHDAQLCQYLFSTLFVYINVRDVA